MDKYGYIGIETLLSFCENAKDHAVTPNDFMRMKRVRMPERKRGRWFYTDGMYACDQCHSVLDDISPWCPMCGTEMTEDKE